jgi:hypothetical protein
VSSTHGVVFLFCLSSPCVPYVASFFWIVHFWLTFRYSLSFIYITVVLLMKIDRMYVLYIDSLYLLKYTCICWHFPGILIFSLINTCSRITICIDFEWNFEFNLIEMLRNPGTVNNGVKYTCYRRMIFLFENVLRYQRSRK